MFFLCGFIVVDYGDEMLSGTRIVCKLKRRGYRGLLLLRIAELVVFHDFREQFLEPFQTGLLLFLNVVGKFDPKGIGPLVLKVFPEIIEKSEGLFDNGYLLLYLANGLFFFQVLVNSWTFCSSAIARPTAARG